LKATMEATSSINLRIAPPKTFPETFASIGIMIRTTVVVDSLGDFAARVKAVHQT
jgi:hypothetical protein